MAESFNSFRLLIVLSGVALVGCASVPPAVSSAAPSPVLKAPAPTAYKINHPQSKVVGAANKIQVLSMLTSTMDSKLFVQVEVFNDRGRRDVFDYRLRWLDAYGLQVVQYEPWSTVSLEGKQSSVLTFRAPRDNVTDFKFELKNHY